MINAEKGAARAGTCSYLEELACRAVCAATPENLPGRREDYEVAKRACTERMRTLLGAEAPLRRLVADLGGLEVSDLDGLTLYALRNDVAGGNGISDHQSRCCREAKDFRPLVELFERNPALQQRLAFALDYVPSRWLLENEIPAVVDRRRLLKADAPGLEATYAGVPRTADGHRDVYAWARENKLTGICLSGGGIRSATFNLGVLQGLAGLGVLKEFDYLSSVSGGGYIHEWLAAWIRREDDRCLRAKETPDGFQRVTDVLRPLPVDATHPFTPEPIRWLRRYSNYLTPRKGLFTADTWVAVAIWVRNTLLNQIVLVSLLFGLALLPQYVLRLPGGPWRLVARVPVSAAAIVLFAWATCLLCYGLRHELRRTRRADVDSYGYAEAPVDAPAEPAFFGEGSAVSLIVVPLLLSAFLGTCALTHGTGVKTFAEFVYGALAVQLAGMALAGGVTFAFWVNHKGAKRPARSVWLRTLLEPVLGLTVLGSLGAALGGVGLFWLVAALGHIRQTPQALRFHLPVFLRAQDGSTAWRAQMVLGPPAMLMVPFFGMVLMAGLVGRNFPDWLREWTARIRAWCLLVSVAWMAFFGTGLFGPVVVHWLGIDGYVYKKTVASIKWTAVLGWLGTTVGGVLAGKSKKVSGTEEDTSRPLEVLALVAPYVFIAGLLVLLSWAAEGAAGAAFSNGARWQPWALVLGPWALFLLFGWRVDVNEFSMNPFYRNRLTRCYLGASNLKRDPNPLTGLDDRDTRGMQVYRFQPGEGYSGPIPIFNTTVNLSFGEDLAYQERKAASFFFSPLFSGYTVGWTSGKERRRQALGKPDEDALSFNGFVPTKQYLCPDGGINVATAVAISGAAASPNGGFHTNPGTAFLMTMFNVRLGWWVANPRRSSLAGSLPGAKSDEGRWPSPRFPFLQLMNELGGRTTDTSEYVYLSDGGHFDNMGLYELVRRRCHRIVICDAEHDTGSIFEGLGNAIRKCRIDFGVEIRLNDISRLRRDPKTGNCKAHFCMGTIRYPESPVGATCAGPAKKRYSVGTLLYLKSSVSGDAKWEPNPAARPKVYTSLDAESVDILNYLLQHKSFPNDTTGNQWFTESQFESYRRLGQHVVEEFVSCKGWNEFLTPKVAAGLERVAAAT